MRSLEYSVETVGAKKSIAILSLDGYVDSATSLNMDEAIDSILQQRVFQVVVDLAAEFRRHAGEFFLVVLAGDRRTRSERAFALRPFADVHRRHVGARPDLRPTD